jgi:hypothetical protein
MYLDDISNWSKPEYPVVVAAKAAGMSDAALRKWFARSYLTPEGVDFGTWQANDQEPEQNGLPRYLSFRSVLHIALTVKLTAKGVPVSDAYIAAARWVHVADVATPVNDEAPKLRRLPGGLFPGPNTLTVFIHFKGSDAKVIAAPYVNGQVKFELSDLMDKDEHRSSKAATIIVLNDLLQHVKMVCESIYDPAINMGPAITDDRE